MRTQGWRACLLLAAALLLGCEAVAQALMDVPEFRNDVDRIEHVRVPMRDGVELATQVYFPEGEGPWPAILVRNPYNQFNIFKPLGKLFARYGYVVVHQDVRGRFASGGEWLPLLNERNDGIDTLNWLVAQPWLDGNIALFGASYLAAVQWAVADVLPPQVKTMIPMIIGTDLRNVIYEKGMFRHEVFTFWAALMPDESMALDNAVNYQKMLRHWPIIEADERFLGRRLDWWRDWLLSPGEDAPLWQRPDAQQLLTMPREVTVPVLMLTGWYDIFIESQLNDFNALGSRDSSRLIVGPWTHLLGVLGDGEKPFPDAGSIGSQMGRIINWLDHHLQGAPLDDWGPIELYEIGGSGWRSTDAFPPPEAERHRFYLRYAKNAANCVGGRLTHRAGPELEVLNYTYDPRNPVPSRGGDALLSFVMPGWQGTPPSNRDQAGLCERSDVLTFMTPPLERPMHLAGPIQVVLHVASTAPDTAFTAKLIEVDARGRALNIRDSITSLAYRNDSPTRLEYTPGTPVTVAIDLWPIQWTIPAGNRLRLDISSSNFPAFAVHPNRAEPWATVRWPRTATQTLYLGGERASYVELTLVTEP